MEKRVLITADRAVGHVAKVFTLAEVDMLKSMLLAIRGSKASVTYLKSEERVALDKLSELVCFIATQPWERHE